MNRLTRQLSFALAMLAGSEALAADATGSTPASPFANGDAATTQPVVTARLMLSVGIPDGFELFHEAQKTLVDVYYGGRLLGTTAASYTLDEIEFLQPDDIVNRIPNAISRTALQQHLIGPIPRNSDLVCPAGQSTGCGKLEPDFIGVIFNEDRFRVDVFVHPDLLFVQARDTSRFLPPPNDPTALTWVQDLGIVTSQSSLAPDAHSVSGNTWVARGTDRVYAEWYNTQDKSISIDQLAWQRDEQDYAYTAGIFRSRAEGATFLQSTLLAGGGFGRSLKLRNDLDTQTATPLMLFLDSRSAVTIYKDGRLISSESYDAGNQQLDTSTLPQGAYDIEIRVTDAGGSTRTINRFYVKTSQLAPQGEPQWYVEAGEVMAIDPDTALPSDAGTAQVRGTWHRRLNGETGVNFAGAIVDTHAIGEANVTWLRSMFNLTGGLMASTQGDAGWNGFATFRRHKLSGSLNMRRVWAEAEGSPDYQLAGSSGLYHNAALNYPVLDGQLTASVDNARSLYSTSEVYALRYTRHFRPEWFPNFQLNTELSHADSDLVFEVSLDIMGVSDHWNWRVNPGMQHTAPRNGAATNSSTSFAQVGWRDGDRWSEDIEASLRANVDDDATTLGFNAMVASDYGRLRATYDDVQGGVLESQYLSASYLTSFVAGSRNFAFGGRQSASGALIVDLRSAPADAEFDLMIDGGRTAVRGGRRVPVLLPPYRTYDVQIVDRGLNFLKFDDAPRQVTLYPGSVVPLAFKVERVVVVFGRILHKQHVCSVIDETCYDIVSPLRNANVGGLAGFSMTDEDGTFQAEMVTGTQRILVTRGTIECDLALPAPRDVNGILVFGDLTCETDIPPEQLPERPLSIEPTGTTVVAPPASPAPPETTGPAAAVAVAPPADPAQAPAEPALAVEVSPPAAAATAPVAATAPGRVVASGRLQSMQRLCMQTDNTCHDIVLPMRNATVRSGDVETRTADDGSFSIEIATDATQLDITRRDRSCTVTLPALDVVDGAVSLGNLRCTLELPPETGDGDSASAAPAAAAAAAAAATAKTGTAKAGKQPKGTAKPNRKSKPAQGKPEATGKDSNKKGNAVRATRDKAAQTPSVTKPRPDKPKKIRKPKKPAAQDSSGSTKPAAGPAPTAAPPSN